MLSLHQFGVVATIITEQLRKEYDQDFGLEERKQLYSTLWSPGACARITIPTRRGPCLVVGALNGAENRVWFVQDDIEQIAFNAIVNRKITRALFPRPSNHFHLYASA